MDQEICRDQDIQMLILRHSKLANIAKLLNQNHAKLNQFTVVDKPVVTSTYLYEF